MSKFGQCHEGQLANDEEHAIAAVILQNYRAQMQNIERKEKLDREKRKSKITLPKLKFMGEK